MVNNSDDPEAIHSRRVYEFEKTRELVKSGIIPPAGADAEGRLNLPDDPSEDTVQSISSAVEAAEAEAGETGTEAQVIVPSASPAPPEDPGAALRRARLSVVVCIVLGLMLAWIVQRRNGSAR